MKRKENKGLPPTGMAIVNWVDFVFIIKMNTCIVLAKS
jgi:hypothetical protein